MNKTAADFDTGREESSYEGQAEWDDGFNEISPTGPTSLASGGPYRSKVPERGSDAGNASMPTDPNSGKSPVGAGHTNATRDTGGGGGGSASSAEYFTPTPGAMNKNLQRIFDMIGEMYVAQQKPPIDGAALIEKQEKTQQEIADSIQNRKLPEYTERRGYTPEQRMIAAKSGAAMKDGSYPIEDKDHLAKAIDRIVKGKAKGDVEAIKTHLVKRAGALDAMVMIPDGWPGKVVKKSDPKSNAEESLSTRLSKTDDLLANVIDSVERMEVRLHRGKATPEAYRLAKTFQAMPVDELAEILAVDAMSKIATNDNKVLNAESLAKQYKTDNEMLLAKIEDANKGLALLSARVQKLADMDMPLKTAGSVHVNREGDQASTEDLARARQTLEGMSEQERALLLTKVALQNPRRMNLNPVSSPPRSVGGTAGGKEELR